jgi:hypothetical protein
MSSKVDRMESFRMWSSFSDTQSDQGDQRIESNSLPVDSYIFMNDLSWLWFGRDRHCCHHLVNQER